MVRFITLWNWTEQGASKMENTVERSDAFAKAAEKLGARIKDFYWTTGEFDGVCVIEAPAETTALAVAAQVSMAGNIRTRTHRAFDAAEMRAVIKKAGK